MPTYFLTEATLGSTPDGAVLAEIRVEPRGAGRFAAHWAAGGESLEAEFNVSASCVASLAAAFPACLQAKVAADYDLAGDTASFLELYAFQAAACLLGLRLALARRLIDGELAAALAGARDLEEAIPWVALLLRREGVPEMRWWEEQAENFIDLWFSPFRLQFQAGDELPSPGGEAPVYAGGAGGSCPARRPIPLDAAPRQEGTGLPFPGTAEPPRTAAFEGGGFRSEAGTEAELTSRVCLLERNLATLMEYMGLRDPEAKEESLGARARLSRSKR